MKQVIIFGDGQRIVGDSLALILPQHPGGIVQRKNITKATDTEIALLKNNPYNDTLIAEIGKRK